MLRNITHGTPNHNCFPPLLVFGYILLIILDLLRNSYLPYLSVSAASATLRGHQIESLGSFYMWYCHFHLYPLIETIDHRVSYWNLSKTRFRQDENLDPSSDCLSTCCPPIDPASFLTIPAWNTQFLEENWEDLVPNSLDPLLYYIWQKVLEVRGPSAR